MHLTVAAWVAGAAFIALLALELLSRRERSRLRSTRLTVTVPYLHPDLQGFRLVFLSDLHVPLMYVPHETLLEAVAELRPDLIALGGDYAGSRFSEDDARELVLDIARRGPTVAVCGNTERYFGWELEHLDRALGERGGRLLRNEAWAMTRGGATVEVLGLDEPIHAVPDAEAALAQADPGADLRIALAHSPAAWQDIAHLRAHIALCGHAHGGQVRLPGLEALIVHWNYPREMASGLFRLHDGREPGYERLADHWQMLRTEQPIEVRAGDGVPMYVSRGVGVTAPRLRLLCPPEVVCVEFVAASNDAKEQATER